MSTAQTVDPAQEVLARSRSAKFRRGLGMLVMTVLLPGSAQVVAGDRRLGRLGLRTWFGLILAILLVAVLALVGRDLLVGLVTSRWALLVLAGAVVVLGGGWVLLLLHAWWVARPAGMGRARGGVFSVIALVLAVSLAGGTAWAASTLRASANLVGTVFGGGGDTQAKAGRYNVLLIGGDAGVGRQGLRADSVTVASVDATTGRTVLFSLPRNLEDVPFPDSSPLKKLYPKGYGCPSHECMLSAIYPLGEQHKDLYPGVALPGVKALTEAVEGVTGLKINYFAMVDLYGFVELVDAVGGIRIDVNKRVPIGGGTSKVSGYIEPGKNKLLNGYEALWFARSRHQSNDYERIQRQKCVMSAMLHQLDPLTVATKFSQLAGATQQIIVTDVPSSEVNRLSSLALKARELDIISVSFTPPLIQPGAPDFARIRKVVAEEITRSQELDKGGSPAPSAKTTAQPTQPTASASASGRRTSTRPSSGKTTTPAASSTPTEPVTEDLSGVCAAR